MQMESRLGRSPLLLTRIATFVAVGVVLGFLLSGIPNVELVTAVCFLSGFLFGFRAGLLTGALTEVIFAGFHPMGSSLGLLLAAQIIGMSLAGASGTLAALSVGMNRTGLRYGMTVVAYGLLTTVFFDFLTNLAFPIMAGFSFSQTLITLAAGVPFAAIHLISNAMVFSLIVVPIIPRLHKTLLWT
ncbi:hypothetical protein EHM69_06440 [candidate division KSB1 bacterium]|nr:MAG: hypothetical protein EHM69_06440 [candidate division KSB1 bacterium]